MRTESMTAQFLPDMWKETEDPMDTGIEPVYRKEVCVAHGWADCPCESLTKEQLEGTHIQRSRGGIV